jgi:hypothetical protein
MIALSNLRNRSSATTAVKPATQVRVRDDEQVGEVPVSWPSPLPTLAFGSGHEYNYRISTSPNHATGVAIGSGA